MIEKNSPTTMDLTITGHVVKAALADEDYSADVAGSVLCSLAAAKEANPAFLVNNKARSIALRTLRSLQSDPTKMSEGTVETIEFLESKRALSPVLQKVAGLKIGLEQVAGNVKAEMRDIIEFERLSESLKLTQSMSTLERAVYNLENINGWVDQDTWLRQYLERVRKPVTLYKAKSLQVYLVTMSAGLLIAVGSFPAGELTGISSAITIPLAAIGIAMNGVGVVMGSEAYNSVGREIQLASHGVKDKWSDQRFSAERLQEHWDTGYTRTVNALAQLDRVKTAKRIQKFV